MVQVKKLSDDYIKIKVDLLEALRVYIENDDKKKAQKKIDFIFAKIQASQDQHKKPKRTSAYVKFFQERFPKMQKEYPEKQSTELMSLIAQEWRSVKGE